ncbi:PspA-associated protein PspAB, partial [Streptomyces sp. DT225]
FSRDAYGYTWLLARRPPEDTAALVNDLHAVNTLLQDGGFGPQLLCSLVAFRDGDGRALALVYLYKRGTFYPFAPVPGGA